MAIYNFISYIENYDYRYVTYQNTFDMTRYEYRNM